MSVTKTAVALLVVGLVVGVVAGYVFAGFFTYQPQISRLRLDLSETQSSLSETESALSGSQSDCDLLRGQLTEATDKLATKEAELAKAANEIETTEAELTQAQTTVTSLETQLSESETRYTTLSSEHEGFKFEAASQIDSLKKELNMYKNGHWLKVIGFDEWVGYRTYSKYGFSFQHPNDMVIEEHGMLESTANYDSGMVLGELTLEKHEVIGLSWLKTEMAPDLVEILEDGFVMMEEAEGVTSLERIGYIRTGGSGYGIQRLVFFQPEVQHVLVFQYFTVTVEGEELYGIFGAWYCDDSQRVITFILETSEEDALPIYQRYLGSILCH